MDPLSLSASHLAHDIVSGTITSEAFCRRLIDKLETLEALNTFAAFDGDRLIHEAQICDKEIEAGKVRGPLHGVPLIIKDNINTQSLPTSGGTPALKDNQPGTDAPIVTSLRQAGALIAGKANLHELSSGGTSANHVFGPVRNPYDLKRVPGGSSGGTAAAVAARLVPAGLGTDTAGSVRVPASLCGVFGFRPTVGRYPATGIVPLSKSLDTAGHLARTIDDIILLDSVIAETSRDVADRDLKSVRLGVAENFMETTDNESVFVLNGALEALERAGAVLKTVDLTAIRELMKGAPAIVNDFEFEGVMREYLETYAPTVSLDHVVERIASPHVKIFTQNRLQAEQDRNAYDHVQTHVLDAYQSTWQALLDDLELDAITYPTTPEVALPLTEDDNVMRNGESVLSWFYFLHTIIASFGRHPGLSIPIGLNRDGMPVGMELDGLPGLDEDLLSTARAIASVLDPLPPPTE